MANERIKKARRHYEKVLPKSNREKKFNFKILISILIISFIAFIKAMPDSTVNALINSTFKTSTNYTKMFSEIGDVIKKHTVGNKVFKMPLDGEITSAFGTRIDPFTNEESNHTGMDISAPLNSEVKSAYDGEVTRVEENEFYGKFIMIRHNDEIETLYGHLSEQLVSAGEKIKKGTVIAKSGDSGKSTGPHLHFEVRKASKPVNPEDFIL